MFTAPQKPPSGFTRVGGPWPRARRQVAVCRRMPPAAHSPEGAPCRVGGSVPTAPAPSPTRHVRARRSRRRDDSRADTRAARGPRPRARRSRARFTHRGTSRGARRRDRAPSRRCPRLHGEEPVPAREARHVGATSGRRPVPEAPRAKPRAFACTCSGARSTTAPRARAIPEHEPSAPAPATRIRAACLPLRHDGAIPCAGMIQADRLRDELLTLVQIDSLSKREGGSRRRFRRAPRARRWSSSTRAPR